MQRRTFLSRTLVGSVGCCVNSVFSATEYDLVIRNGRIIDPGNGVDAIADIAIRGEQVAAVAANLPAAGVTRIVDAAGLLVVPGLIDVHVHARDAELPPSEFLSTGVTTMVDAGSRGADNVAQLVDVARDSPNRMRILLNIGVLGNNPGGRSEFLDGLDQADVQKGLAAIERYQDWIVGVKARLSRGVAVDRDREVLRRAIELATPFGLPVMIHIGDTATPLPELLALLRPGDIVTHMYAPTPNGILDENGLLLPAVLAARERGIRFDFGNGLNEHWNWDVAERAVEQGFLPDTISSDLNVPGRTAQVFDLPNVLSKFLLLGMSLPEVIKRATSNAAESYGQLNGLGSLAPGAIADITLLEASTGRFEFSDNYQGTRTGSQRLIARGVFTAGMQSV